VLLHCGLPGILRDILIDGAVEIGYLSSVTIGKELLRNSIQHIMRLATVSLLVVFTGCVVVDWVDSEFSCSKVVNPQPTPKFEIPAKTPGTRYLQFEAVGDFGTGAGGQRDVAVSMAKKAESDSISFVLVLGDNFYESGVASVNDEQWESAFEHMYDQPSLNVPFYAILGNHDYRTNPEAQVEYTNVSKRWKMPQRYFTFVRAIDDTTTSEYFCLDTNPLAYLSVGEAKSLSDTSQEKRQLQWLSRQLEQSTARWKIVLGHHPLYSGGEHGDNETLQYLLEPIFTKYKVDFYLCGHDHDLELLKPIHGVTYVVSGAGSKHRDVRWRENTRFAETNLGFVFFRISANESVVEFLNRSGSVQYAYTVQKSAR
jgi:tartrate-resistant acid phosphatase type 5